MLALLFGRMLLAVVALDECMQSDRHALGVARAAVLFDDSHCWHLFDLIERRYGHGVAARAWQVASESVDVLKGEQGRPGLRVDEKCEILRFC